jgi:membrane protease YdiL (CAAX protease family)
MEETPVVEQDQAFAWERLDLALFAAFSVATVLFLPLVALVLMRVLQPDLEVTNLSGVQQVLIQALMDLVLVGFIIFLIRTRHGGPVLRTLRLIPGTSFSRAFLIAAGCFLAITVVAISAIFPTPSESPLEKLLTTIPSIIAFVVFGIAFAPLLEEVIFRGFLFGALMDVAGPRSAVVATSLLFAALHAYQLWGNWPAVAVIFLVGYILTVIRQRTDSLIPSIIMHTAYNATIFGISGLGALLGFGSEPQG